MKIYEAMFLNKVGTKMELEIFRDIEFAKKWLIKIRKVAGLITIFELEFDELLGMFKQIKKHVLIKNEWMQK